MFMINNNLVLWEVKSSNFTTFLNHTFSATSKPVHRGKSSFSNLNATHPNKVLILLVEGIQSVRRRQVKQTGTSSPKSRSLFLLLGALITDLKRNASFTVSRQQSVSQRSSLQRRSNAIEMKNSGKWKSLPFAATNSIYLRKQSWSTACAWTWIMNISVSSKMSRF